MLNLASVHHTLSMHRLSSLRRASVNTILSSNISERRSRIMCRQRKVVRCMERTSNILPRRGWILMLRLPCRLHSTRAQNQHRENYGSSATAIDPKKSTHKLYPRNPESHEDSMSAREHSANVVRLTQQLLSKPYSLEIFKSSLENARNNETLLKTLGLSKSDAKSMFILNPDLLKHVHMVISHFSNSRNFRGIALDHPSDGTAFAKHDKIPGPILCARLLELIGVPNYYSDISATSSASPILVVHSSQIDQLLHCCLQTTLALSNCCKTGKGSLIGYDFNFEKPANDHATFQDTEKKTAAHLAEEIWRTVRNMQIKFTFDMKRKEPRRIGSIMHMPNTSTRISAMNNNFVLEYLNAADSSTPKMPASWSNKDHRRYNQALSLFNAVLAAYSRLGSSATGERQEVRRNMVQSAERLLLELAAKAHTLEPSSSTVLQCTRPDVISFNTAMNAWSQLSPKVKKGVHADEYATTLSTLTAERTQAILEMMQELWDEERSNRSTRQTLQASWDEYGDGKLCRSQAIAPSTSSYNTVLNAWSRSSNNDAIYKAISVFRAMLERCNLMCIGRVSLTRQNSNSQHVGTASLEGDHAFPDSRTFVAILGSCSCNSGPMNFGDAVALIEAIFDTMKCWDEQLRWSTSQGVSPHGLLTQNGNNTNSILNAYTFNALIKAFAAIPKSSWEESLQCCYRIEEIILQDMLIHTAPDAITRGIAVDAWAKCAKFAKHDEEKMTLCVEKACTHVDLLLLPESMLQHGLPGDEAGDGSRTVHLVNDVIALCGECSFPAKADELFLRAKECKINNFTTISTVIDVLSQSKDILHVEKALNHLLDFERDVMQKSSAIVPSLNHEYTRMYNACIVGFINAEQNDIGCSRAYDLLSYMINNQSSPLHVVCPNTTSFALVMNALAQKGRSGQVEALLSKMEELRQRRKDTFAYSQRRDLEPNIVLYNTLMTSYAYSNDIGALQSAEILIQRMEDDPNIPSPDAITHSLILKLRSHNHSGRGRQAEHPASCGSETASTLHDIVDCKLDKLILDTIHQSPKPNAKVFNSIMKAHASKGTEEGAEKSAALLRRIEEMYAAGDIHIRPDIILHNLVLNAWQNFDPIKAEEHLSWLCACHESDKDLSPNDASFSICIHAWCKSTRPNAAEQAERILRQKEAFLNRVDGLVIRTTDYNSIISKWRDDPEHGPKRAALLFEEMLQKSSRSKSYQCPTDVTLNALLAVCAKSIDDKAAEHAEDILKRMSHLYEDKKSNILPDVISYRTCIAAWIRRKSSESPHKVEALVNDMIDKYKNHGRDDLRPDSNVFDLILKACNLAPTAWNAEDEDKRNGRTISIANRTFTLLRGENEFNAKPTHSTFAFMFRIFNRHMSFTDPRYDLLMKNLWAQCCRDGLVSEFTLESLRKSVTESTFFECIGCDKGGKTVESITVGSLPREWRRNVSPKRA
ncbi:hypothetical protein ACHAW6_014501 [Cyclotella cf. meneghiniana]